MSKDEESKKFAKISPTKVEKAMNQEEIDALKTQLEQYYSGKNVEDAEQIISKTKLKAIRPFRLTMMLLFFVLTMILVLIFKMLFQHSL